MVIVIWIGSKRHTHLIGIDVENVRKFAEISNSYVQNKGIVLLRSMGLEKITMTIILICTNVTYMEG